MSGSAAPPVETSQHRATAGAGHWAPHQDDDLDRVDDLVVCGLADAFVAYAREHGQSGLPFRDGLMVWLDDLCLKLGDTTP
ncbi:hypothetical protein [Jiangella rhizosphaerae]|uniref:hypothetical protein n=1 Tax=Jiangella rhizosphaerae TaxID=2293569 RepID=UPI0011C4011E|nr:hypothetical protein [Jiangella rhizosphaerae]